MPTVGLFHGSYWNLSDTNAAPVHIGKGGYPLWQASVITPSLFGVLSAFWDTFKHWARWWLRWGQVIHALNSDQRMVLERVLKGLTSPAFPKAQQSVKQTAQTPGFDYLKYSRIVKADFGRAENIFRHVKACEDTRLLVLSSTLTNPEVNLLVELAYCAYAKKGRYYT